MGMFLKRQSPFIYEDFVPREKFFDRDEELEFFLGSISVKRKILLYIVAPLKYGKTSLMMRYYEMLKDFDDIIPIYVDLKRKERPIWYIVKELKRIGIDVEEIYNVCLKETSLEPLFDAINGIIRKNNKWLFLLFDEFHLLPSRVKSEGFYDRFSSDDIFGFFRGFAEGARISYVVCGSIIEPLMNALDVWGGRFEIIYLGPFKKQDAIEMIKKLFEEGGMLISDEDANIIAEAAGYHPFYIQYLGHHIYIAGKIDKTSIRNAKKRLYNFLIPIFEEYFEKIMSIKDNPEKVIMKILNKETLEPREIVVVAKLRRMGIIKPSNGEYIFVDPLFKRYLKNIIQGYKPIEITIVGHWAERIIGNYLLRKGYTPYYSHDSRGAFDIYVKIGENNVGIQVKYSATGNTRLTDKDIEKIHKTAKETGWIPILALVSKKITFHKITEAKEYRESNGEENIEKVLYK